MYKDEEKLSKILDSIINRKHIKMVEQINEYGACSFWEEYEDYLHTIGDEIDVLYWFKDTVISYFMATGGGI